jgi:sialidase-1
LAFAEGRLESCSDSTKIVRLVCKRSTDNGSTWGPLQVVARNIIRGEEFSIHNISPMVDTVRGTGRVTLVYNKCEYNEWQVTEGLGVDRVFCISSDDNGATWNQEIDITQQVHKPYNPDYLTIYSLAAESGNRTADWRNQRPSQGHGLQLQGPGGDPSLPGRLIQAGAFSRSGEGVFHCYNYVFWSDDLGETWEIGGIIDQERVDGSSPQGLNEAIAVELENGDLMINSRNYLDGAPVGKRAVTIGSFDEAGDIHFSLTRHDATLISPAIQASLLRYTYSYETEYGGKSRLLFSNPAHLKARVNLTLRLSYDEGVTWPVGKVIDPGPSAYSDLVIQSNMRISILYERGNHGGIHFVSCDLDWLTDGEDNFD